MFVGSEQRSESDQQRIGHIGQQNFAGRGSGRGGRDTGRSSGGGGDATSRWDHQPYHPPSSSDRGRQPRQSTVNYLNSYVIELPFVSTFTEHVVRVVDVINHTRFDNDRSREYKVTEGRILACCIGMACRL